MFPHPLYKLLVVIVDVDQVRTRAVLLKLPSQEDLWVREVLFGFNRRLGSHPLLVVVGVVLLGGTWSLLGTSIVLFSFEGGPWSLRKILAVLGQRPWSSLVVVVLVFFFRSEGPFAVAVHRNEGFSFLGPAFGLRVGMFVMVLVEGGAGD